MLNWTEDQKATFLECQKAVIECRKLYYEMDGAPIRVYTDASEYGIGSYLCQVKEDEVEIPIEIISKTLKNQKENGRPTKRQHLQSFIL